MTHHLYVVASSTVCNTERSKCVILPAAVVEFNHNGVFRCVLILQNVSYFRVKESPNSIIVLVFMAQVQCRVTVRVLAH